jgi:pimeloyl-ACP methyl ester carboxylesterase
VNENIGLLEEREKLVIPAFPPPEIVASRIDAIRGVRPHRGSAEINTPTLVICAKDDILTPPYFSRELARAIPARARGARTRRTLRVGNEHESVQRCGSRVIARHS